MKKDNEEQHTDATEYYIKMADDFIRSLQGMGTQIPGGIAAWEDVFRQWHKLVRLATVHPDSLQRSLREFSTLGNAWRKGSLRLFDEWNDCLMRLADTCRMARTNEDDTRQVIKACLVSYEEFFDKLRKARFSFATEQMKAYFGFVRSFLPEDIDANERHEDVDKKAGGGAS